MLTKMIETDPEDDRTPFEKFNDLGRKIFSAVDPEELEKIKAKKPRFTKPSPIAIPKTRGRIAKPGSKNAEQSTASSSDDGG